MALAPDDYKFEGCYKSAARLREGISPEERLNADAGVLRPRPENYGIRNARSLGFRYYPDAIWFYGKEDFDLIETWRKCFLDWERKWLGKHEIFDVLASPRRFQSIEQFVLIKRQLESFGYRFYSDYWDAHKKSEASYERMEEILNSEALLANHVTRRGGSCCLRWYLVRDYRDRIVWGQLIS